LAPTGDSDRDARAKKRCVHSHRCGFVPFR
jgi:hypothetical protein